MKGYKYERGNANFCVGHIPKKKKIALYYDLPDVNGFRVLGWFNTEEDARQFKILLDALIQPVEIDIDTGTKV